MKNLTKIWLLSIATMIGLAGLAGDARAQDTDKKAEAPEAEESSTNAVTKTSTDDDSTEFSGGIRRDAVVALWHDAILKAGETANAVVAIGGNAKVQGKVHDAVVVIGGDIDLDGADVRDTAVAVFGNIKAQRGAKVRNGAVAVFGSIDAADGTVIRNPVEIDPGGLGTALRQWFRHCALKMRPLAPQVGWVWVIAGFFFLIYFLLAALLPRPVELCVGELARRPATTFLLGMLAKLLIPVVLVLLVAIGVGIIVAPFIIAALIFGAMVGKVALMEWIGSGIGNRFGAGGMQKPLVAFLIGLLLIVLLYMVPVVGLITFGVVSVWGLGCAIAAASGSLRREMPEKPKAMPAMPLEVPSTSMPFVPPPSPSPSDIGPSAPGSPSAAPELESAVSSIPTATATLPPTPVLPEALAYPKAGLWERLGAAFLDLVLVGIVGALIGGPPQAFVVVLAYFTGMWAWKGTTIGGIVLGLKVVRMDGQSLTFTVALVRALATAFATIILFLGIIWIAWDQDKQGWHDKIAGTIVLRLPRGTPLI